MPKKEEDKALLERVREEFEEMKLENLKNKQEGKKYDPHFDGLDTSFIDEEGALLWNKYKDIKNKEDAQKMLRSFRDYQNRIGKEIHEELGEEDSKNISKVINHPKNLFLGYLGNKISVKIYQFLE